jgi:acyl dehydratase
VRYPEVLSLPARSVETAFTRQDVILHALGVGVGLDGLGGDDLRFVYEKELLTLPTMATTLLGGDGGLIAQAGVDVRRMLHSEERLTIHRPLPPEGRVRTTSRIVNVADKGQEKGAVINMEHAITDAETEAPYATVVMTLFCRGDGGYGGPNRDLFPAHTLPDRTPDRETLLPTAPNQAALYRISMRDVAPLHIDPEVAAAAGFERPILHGLCTYAVACRAVMKAHAGGDPARIRSFDARFAAPFYPGETLLTRTWRDGDVVSFECLAAERGVTVFKNGRCEIAG